jgi:hypothetical protein
LLREIVPYRRAASFSIRFWVWSFLNFVNLIFSAI